VNGGDDRLGRPFDALEIGLPGHHAVVGLQDIHAAHLVHVATGAEMAALAGDQHDAHATVGEAVLQQLTQPPHHLRGDRIALGRAIQPENRDGTATLA
jgi:hypothetical protein